MIPQLNSSSVKRVETAPGIISPMAGEANFVLGPRYIVVLILFLREKEEGKKGSLK